MSGYTKFDSEIYSEEIYPVSEQEYDEAMAASTVEDDGWRGYGEWAASLEETERAAALEQYAYEHELERKVVANTPRGAILIKRDCNHRECRSSRCDREIQVQGVAI